MIAPNPFGLSIVIPVYNGAASIAQLVDALARLQPTDGLEIILVNDASEDGSAAVCREIVKTAKVNVSYVEHTRNFGEHNAVMTGLRRAVGAYVITMDDDLQNPPEEVLRLYDHARNGGWDVVYARYLSKEHPGWRNVGSRFANKLADFLLEKPKGLYLSSFRCMSALVAGSVGSYSGPFPYVDGLIFQVTQRIDSLEVRHTKRYEGLSNYNLRRLVGLWLSMSTSFSLAPLRLAVLAGAVTTTLGACVIVAVMTETMWTKSTPPGWASIMIAILLLSGVQSMMLGLIGEYVGRTFLSANGKPQALVRTVEKGYAADVLETGREGGNALRSHETPSPKQAVPLPEAENSRVDYSAKR
jgi:undecaprenyl-phosphate 4-deoxy-4-formamido-L-arabinose transferase